jgi:hypothetical protein
MMKKILFLFLFLYSYQVFSQLYTAIEKGPIFYGKLFVNINKDSAHVEIFETEYPDFCFIKKDEFLLSSNTSKDTCFVGKQTKLLKRRNDYYLIYKNNNSNKTKEIKLELCQNDERKTYRNNAYATKKRICLHKLEDSLSGPGGFINVNVNNTIRSIPDSNATDSTYRELVDHFSDSLLNRILMLKDPIVDYYYKVSDSIDKLDTAEINKLLLNASYDYAYGQYFLYKLSVKRPAFLVSYIDINPPNKKSLLKAIRHHNNYKEIIKEVKNTKPNTKGKKEIVRQKFNRNCEDGLVGAAVVTVYVAFPLGLLTLLTFWII